MENTESFDYLLETHLHTKGNSPCAKASPKSIAKRYRRYGYGGIICTNHFNLKLLERYYPEGTLAEKLQYFLSGYERLREYCTKKGVDVFFGMELARRNCEYFESDKCSEILVIGITPEEFLKYNVALPDMSLRELFDTANRENWLLFQSHPYRARTEILDTSCLHGEEIYNHHPGHNNHNSDARALAEANGLLPLSGSDYHFVKGNGGGIYLPRAPKNEKDLVELLKSRNYKLKTPKA